MDTQDFLGLVGKRLKIVCNDEYVYIGTLIRISESGTLVFCDRVLGDILLSPDGVRKCIPEGNHHGRY